MQVTKEQLNNTQTLDGLAVLIEIASTSNQPDKDSVIKSAQEKILQKATVNDYQRYKKYIDPVL